MDQWSECGSTLTADISIQLWKALHNFGRGLYTHHLKSLASSRLIRALC